MMQEFKDRVKLGVSPSTTVTTLEAKEQCFRCGSELTRDPEKVSQGYAAACLNCDEDMYDIEIVRGDQFIAGGDEARGDWITIKWHVDDVLEVRPDLTRDQARTVLYTVKSEHDANLGVNWEVIEDTADHYYPKGEHDDE